MSISPILLAISVTLFAGNVFATCRIRSQSMSLPQPLLLNNTQHADVHSFIQVDSLGYAYLNAGENITFFCVGPYNYLSGGNFPMLQYAVAYCDGTNFIIDGRTATPHSATCYSDPIVDVKVSSGDNHLLCGENERIIEVGFNVFGSFLKLYEVCFNSYLQTPTYTRHLVVPGARTGFSRKMSAYLYGPVDPVKAYEKASQTASFTEQLDSASASKYITSSNLLQYQMLVPYLDFVLPGPQVSTYYYFNTVPAWKLFINGYWLALEKQIRTLTDTEGDLEVTVGVHGIAVLNDSQGTSKNVFLHSANTQKAIPIPAYLTKSVRNSRNEVVIFLQAQVKGEVSRSVKAEGLCAEDVCAQLRWLPWAQVPAAQRPVACCAANDALLLRRIPQLSAQLRGDSQRASAGLLVGRGARHHA